MKSALRVSGVIAGAIVLAAGVGTTCRAQSTDAAVPASSASKQSAAGERAAPKAPEPPKVDLLNDPTLYVVAYAHLDTEWRWDYVQTIKHYVGDTLTQNFALIDKYPGYVFNFSGSRRYQFMKEYYPEQYEKLKGYVAQGRWFPCGSSVDENDANVPSAESFVRHVLYGNKYFQDEFGVTSAEFMLPDCFGFPAALPSMLAHCGLKGFSTQKLTWGSPVGIPFKVGVWEGPDGRSIIAALDPGAYVGEVRENLATSTSWLKRIQNNGEKSGGPGKGVFTDYHYYGTGDMGGGPRESSVEMVEKSLNTPGPVKVISGPADWMFKAITPEMAARLPKYTGELLLTEHSAGSVTSQAYMKRWNRTNEQLAEAAEKAASIAMWLGHPYPSQKLEDAWYLILGSQMHDILPGTSLPKAYEYAWNDEVLAGRMLSDVLTDSVSAIASQMDTRPGGDGTDRKLGSCVAVFNPLSVQRYDVVEVAVPFAGDSKNPPKTMRVKELDLADAPAQVLGVKDGLVRALCIPRVPSVGMAVLEVIDEPMDQPIDAGLSVSERVLENGRFKVSVNDAGDIASVYDKVMQRETLSGPVRLGLHYEKPKEWPAWNMDWADRQMPARSFVGDGGTPARITITERGPVRVALRIEREHEGSRYVQHVRLAAVTGDEQEPWARSGQTVEVETELDWNTRERSLKAHFPLASANPVATFDVQVGTIQRGNNTKDRYENPAHMWMDVTEPNGRHGVSILNDSKYGSDKPDDQTLRLTLVYTPGVRSFGYQDQATQDIGRHRMVYAIAPHAGDWRAGQTAWLAARLNQPLRAFRVDPHYGRLGKLFRFFRADPETMVTAIKKAERSDELIVRVRELTGTARELRMNVEAGIRAAAEVDGQERRIGSAQGGRSGTRHPIRGYGLHAFAISTGGAPAQIGSVKNLPVSLPHDVDVVSTNADRSSGEMEPARSYPAEQWPRRVVLGQAEFALAAHDAKNATSAKGQRVALPAPAEEGDQIAILAASVEGDLPVTFMLGDRAELMTIHRWRGYVGQWDNRIWDGTPKEVAFQWPHKKIGLEPGFVRDVSPAWFCTHHHTTAQDDHYQFSHMFAYRAWLPKGATSVTLPDEPRVRVMAMSVIRGGFTMAVPCTPLMDTLADHVQDAPRIGVVSNGAGSRSADGDSDSVEVVLSPRLYGRPGAIRYTLDGTEPGPDSKAFAAPITLHDAASVRAAVLKADGAMGPTATSEIKVSDTTPPRVVSVQALDGVAMVDVQFSEPIDVGVNASAFSISPEVAITGARVEPADGTGSARRVRLKIAQPLVADRAYTLTVSGVADASPRRNVLAEAEAPLMASGPVYRLDEIGSTHIGAVVQLGRSAKRPFPSRGDDPFTLNVFVKPDKQPDNRTIIVGFGALSAKGDGTGRTLAKFAGGLHFWSHNRDASAEAPLRVGEWQMLSATYDGSTLKLYMDAKLVSTTDLVLADDEPVVHILPTDPWEKKRRFEGAVAGLSIWDRELSAEALRSMQGGFVPPGARTP